MRFLRLLTLLFVSSMTPILFAQSADVSVAIKAPSTVIPDSIALNTGITYTITNAGPDAATNVTFTTNIRYTYVTLPPAFGQCSYANPGMTCTASSLPPGTYQIEFTVFTHVHATGPYPINASVSSSTADPDLSNNSSSTSIAVVFKSDLAIGFGGPDAYARAGGPLRTEVYWYTNGPSAVEDLTVVVDVPPGFKPNGLVSTDFPSNGDCKFPGDYNGGQIVCHFGTQEWAGDIIFYGTAADTLAPGTRLSFKSTVSSPVDTSAGNDTETGSAVILAPTDLVVTLDAGRVEAGWMAARVVVRNVSAVEAKVPLVEIAFDSQMATFTKAPAGWKCGSYTLNIPGGIHTGCKASSLAPGASATFEFSAILLNQKTSRTVETVATSINADSTPADNRVIETASFTAATDWAVQASAPATAPFATDVTVNVIAKKVDGGPSAAQVMYTVPAGADLVSYPGGVCMLAKEASATIVECGADKDATFPIVIRPHTPGTYLHQARVNVWAAATPEDPVPSNNAAVSKTEVENPWTLNLTVSCDASPTTPIRGQPVTYTIAVTNGGGAPTPSVTITDTLPETLVLASAPDTCTSANSTLTCTLPSLAPGEIGTLSFTAVPLTAGEIVNTVTAGPGSTATATIHVSAPRTRSVRH